QISIPFNSESYILVISGHRFYDHLRFEIFEATTTVSGKLKGPFTLIDIMPLLWSSQNIQVTKFFAAINSFSHNYANTNPAVEIAALRTIQQNPLNLPIYIHDRKVAEKVNAKSLMPIQLHSLAGQIEVTVVKKLPFFEISASYIHHDQHITLHSFSIKHRYFMHLDGIYFLIDNISILHTIEFFRSKPKKFIIHNTKYNEFFKNILLPIEEFLNIN